MRSVFVLFVASLLMVPAHAEKAASESDWPWSKTVLVYKGPGACTEKCSSAAEKVAVLAGYKARVVGPEALNEHSSAADIKKLFKNVKVWVQPGGTSDEAAEAMTPTLKNALVSFVQNGGGYVGICAGAFLATREIGTTGLEGFGIFPGMSAPYDAATANPDVVFSFEKVSWFGKPRSIYFEGGPYFYGYENTPGTETVATFSDGSAAAVRGTFGKGRVFLTGPHPEAPISWSREDHVKDPDGVDHDLAESMIKWVAGQEQQAHHHSGRTRHQ